MRQSNALVALSFGFGVAGSLLGGSARGDGSSAPGMAGTAGGPPGAAAPAPRPSAAPTASPSSKAAAPDGPRSILFSKCYEGFAPRVTPRVDVTRLGLACGPVTGLMPFGKTMGVVDEATAPAVFRWDVRRGECFRVFAVASAPVDDLEIEIVTNDGATPRLVNQNRRWAVVAEDRPICATRDGRFEARFSTHAGHGSFAATVWRGERMLPRRK